MLQSAHVRRWIAGVSLLSFEVGMEDVEGLLSSRGMMVELVKQVHLQKEVGAGF